MLANNRENLNMDGCLWYFGAKQFISNTASTTTVHNQIAKKCFPFLAVTYRMYSF